MELPQGHALRSQLDAMKSKFEQLLDEYLGSYILLKSSNIKIMIQQHVKTYMEYGIQYISFDPAPIPELRLKDFADGDDISEIAGRCTSEVARLNM